MKNQKRPQQKTNLKSQQNLRLALDIGTNSIGWALYGLRNKKPENISGAGVRIFSSGRNDKDWTTLNATRRQKRLERRQRDRYLQRRSYLLHILKKHGLFPKADETAQKLKILNPYELRAKGLDKKLDLFHFGRALLHLNQRRGFKSNRKSADIKESGTIKQSIKASKNLMTKYNSRTYGEFLWRRFQKMEKSRKKPGSQQENWVLARRAIEAKTKDSYAVYSNRQMMEDEFSALWDSQSRFHDTLKNENLKNKFFKAIFFQRRLKKPIIGKCALTEEKRISKADPYFQKFRILKELNNLDYIDSQGKNFAIVEMNRGLEFRDKIINNQFLKKVKITFKQLEKDFKKFFPNTENFSHFNLNAFNREDLEGDKTAYVISKIVPGWSKWSLEIQSQFIAWLEGENIEDNFIKDDEEVLEDLKRFNKDKELELSERDLKNCLDQAHKLPNGHGKYSKDAIQKILPFLEKGQKEDRAVRSAGFSDRKHKNDLINKLPEYQEVLDSHCLESIKKENKAILSFEDSKERQIQEISNDKIKNDFLNEFKSAGKLSKIFLKKYQKKTGKKQIAIEKIKKQISNPTVHIAFNQLRLVINDIIRIYGKPSQIVVETARDLPLGAETKRELEKSYKANKEKNNEARQAIENFGQTYNRDNRIRYLLWKEQNKTCVYSGQKMPQAKLWTAELEVDHILPWSKTLDDSFSNKVLVYKSSNQNKADKTPFEFFSSNNSKWEGILYRIKDLPKNKQWRFNKNAMADFLTDSDFLARQLNDTRYISKCAREYLERICGEVWTARGQTTSILRHLLQYDRKNREDHRNHAKDALAIGLIDRSFVKRISEIAKKIEGQNKERLENVGKAIKTKVLPWDSFEEDAKKAIDKIVVSHRKKDKKTGQLHKETAYSVSPRANNFSAPIEVFHHVDILNLKQANNKKIEKIVSDNIRKDFLQELKSSGKISKEFIEDYHKKTGIRRIHLREIKTVRPIKNQAGQIYKAFSVGSNYAMALFETPDGKWDVKVIDMFTANQKNFKPISKASYLIKNDMLFFENRFWRLVKFDRNKNLIFLEHFASGNPDIMRKREETKELVKQIKPGYLQELKPQRVNISPSGKFKITPFNLKKNLKKKAN